MELLPFLKSVLEQDRSAVVLCDLEDTIIYMNPAAGERYAKWGGMELVGKSLLDCHSPQSNVMIKKVVAWFQENSGHNLIYTFRNEKENKDVYMVALRDDDGTLIGYYEKHEYRHRETMKLYDFEP
ncbi:MAG: PAS domain-containing protein [Clostridiales bacterium]|nr:PAS domain-containing protein [Clostridiales bacterium]